MYVLFVDEIIYYWRTNSLGPCHLRPLLIQLWSGTLALLFFIELGLVIGYTFLGQRMKGNMSWKCGFFMIIPPDTQISHFIQRLSPLQ